MQFNFVTAPITNERFRERVITQCQTHLQEIESYGLSDTERANPSLAGPIIPTLTDEDTSLFPSGYVSSVVAYSSPWIDLASGNPLVANLSRQILNLEVAYANFCGVRSVVIPGPREDGNGKQVAQYARAIQEAFQVATRVNFIIHMPMYREPGLEETEEILCGSRQRTGEVGQEIDLFSTWDTWHTIRSVCNYNMRLFVGKTSQAQAQPLLFRFAPLTASVQL